jgi:hypothetical protein
MYIGLGIGWVFLNCFHKKVSPSKISPTNFLSKNIFYILWKNMFFSLKNVITDPVYHFLYRIYIGLI